MIVKIKLVVLPLIIKLLQTVPPRYVQAGSGDAVLGHQRGSLKRLGSGGGKTHLLRLLTLYPTGNDPFISVRFLSLKQAC